MKRRKKIKMKWTNDKKTNFKIAFIQHEVMSLTNNGNWLEIVSTWN